MTNKKWTTFPHDAAAFQYPGKSLATHWARLHRGDCEPLPTVESLAERIEVGGIESPAKEVAAAVQDAWRAFHRGDYQHAYELGTKLGLPGFAVAIKAVGVYATYLESNQQRAQELLLKASQHAAAVIEQLPKDPNAHYLFAYTLGRYSERISIMEALARGYAKKFEHALTETLKLEPKHADAHIALGLYHAEIVGRLGALAGGLTYGATSGKAIEHFHKAIKLNPETAIGKLEYAHGLKLLDGESAAEIEKLLQQAAHCKPHDAMEKLDCARAEGLLETV